MIDSVEYAMFDQALDEVEGRIGRPLTMEERVEFCAQFAAWLMQSEGGPIRLH